MAYNEYEIQRLIDSDLERNFGIKAKQIAEVIGANKQLDEKIVNLSDRRFKEVEKAFREYLRKENSELRKDQNFIKDRYFGNRFEVYAFNVTILQTCIIAIQDGAFNKTLEHKAKKGYRDLMLFLVENGLSYEALSLSGIQIDFESLSGDTLDEYLHKNYEPIKERYFSLSEGIKTSDILFQKNIFSKIVKGIKYYYKYFQNENKRRIESEIPLLSNSQKIEYINNLIKKLIDDEKKENEYKHKVSKYIKKKISTFKAIKEEHKTCLQKVKQK